MSTDSALRIVVVYPDLLGTYGDGGNGLVLARRAEWRGYEVELIQAPSDQPLPTADLYTIGGGEDGPQVRAAEALRTDGTLRRAADAGAVVLAVCAGYQIVGSSFPGADGRDRPGVGLLDISTRRGTGPRAVGEVRAEPLAAGGLGDLPTMTGFENHAGVTRLGPAARPLARVVTGVGNGAGGEGSGEGRGEGRGELGATEGAWSTGVVGTYLHGPVLARNPALADLLLAWAIGGPDPLAPLDDRREDALRAERLRPAGSRRQARR